MISTKPKGGFHEAKTAFLLTPMNMYYDPYPTATNPFPSDNTVTSFQFTAELLLVQVSPPSSET